MLRRGDAVDDEIRHAVEVDAARVIRLARGWRPGGMQMV
jgi:hypothetical protein